MSASALHYRIVPGWQGSAAEHWQSHWQRLLPSTSRVEQSDWLRPQCQNWIDTLQQAIEALGGVRVGERSYDEATYEANEKALEDFRQEFDRIRDAYWYNADADTYVIRHADKAIWVVVHARNDDGGIMVAEGPLPPPAT